MARVSKEERRKALRDRTRDNYDNRDSGSGGKRLLDLSGLDPRPTFFSPKDGEFYNIDIIPYIVKGNNHPQGMKPGYEDYLLDVWVHRKVGPGEDTMICLRKTYGKPCPICEEADALRKSGDADEKEVQELAPKRRCIYNVINLDSKDQKIQLMEASYHLFEKLLLAAAQVRKDEIVSFSDLDEGQTVKFTGKKKSMGQYSFVEFTGIGFLPRQPYDEKILDESYPLDSLLVVPTYEQVRNAFYGVSEEEEEEKAPEPTRVRRERTADAGPRRPVDPSPGKPVNQPEEEVPENSHPPRRERPARQATEAPKGKCPYGHSFGTNCDKMDECPDCDIWEQCVEEFDRLNG